MPGTTPESLLSQARTEARQALQHIKMPTPKDEAWRYTDIRRLKLPATYASPELTVSSRHVIRKQHLSDEDMPLLHPYRHQLFARPRDRIEAVHAALCTSSSFFFVPDAQRAVLDITMSCSTDTMHSLYVFVGKQATLQLLMRQQSSAAPAAPAADAMTAMTVSLQTYLVVQEGAQLHLSLLEKLNEQATLFHTLCTMIDRDASCRLSTALSGAGLGRQDMQTFFIGQGAQCENRSCFVASSRQHMDITADAHHLAPHTQNNILNKGLLLGASSSVFRGLIRIVPEAQQTDSYLSDHTLMLSSLATANSIPSLKIDANDVRASHGATVTHIEDEQLFYLLSRGLGREEASLLVSLGFVQQALENMDQQLRDAMVTLIKKRIQAAPVP